MQTQTDEAMGSPPPLPTYSSLRAIVGLSSKLPLEALGALLSQRAFAGLPFGGLEKGIRDEVPAIFIPETPLGFQVILCTGLDDYYSLSVETHGLSTRERPAKSVGYYRINDNLFVWLSNKLREDADVVTVLRFDSE